MSTAAAPYDDIRELLENLDGKNDSLEPLDTTDLDDIVKPTGETVLTWNQQLQASMQDPYTAFHPSLGLHPLFSTGTTTTTNTGSAASNLLDSNPISFNFGNVFGGSYGNPGECEQVVQQVHAPAPVSFSSTKFDVVCPDCGNTKFKTNKYDNFGLEMLPGGAGGSRRSFVCTCGCKWNQRMRSDDECSNRYGPTDKQMTLSQKKAIQKPSGDVSERLRHSVVCPVSLGGCNRAFVPGTKNQTIFQIGGVDSGGLRYAFLCQGDKGGCNTRWSQNVWDTGDEVVAKPCKAKAWFEKPKRVRNPETNRCKKQRKETVPNGGAKCTLNFAASSTAVNCALCTGVLPEENTDEFATQCIACNQWFCHGIRTDCAQNMTTDENYNPLCTECAK